MRSGEVIWVVNHFRLTETDDENEHHEHYLIIKGVGNYTSRAKAEAAVARLIDLEGFRDFPGGFRVSEEVLDRDRKRGDHWPRY